jgi:hypothetical protein
MVPQRTAPSGQPGGHRTLPQPAGLRFRRTLRSDRLRPSAPLRQSDRYPQSRRSICAGQPSQAGRFGGYGRATPDVDIGELPEPPQSNARDALDCSKVRLDTAAAASSGPRAPDDLRCYPAGSTSSRTGRAVSAADRGHHLGHAERTTRQSASMAAEHPARCAAATGRAGSPRREKAVNVPIQGVHQDRPTPGIAMRSPTCPMIARPDAP